MAKKQVSSRSGGITPKSVVFKPPLQGLNDHTARNVLPGQVSEFLLNVVPRDRLGVLRIAKRCGFAKAFATAFPDGSSSSSSSIAAATYTFDGGVLGLAANYTPTGIPGAGDRVIAINKIASGGSNSADWDYAGGTIALACSFDSGSNTMSSLTLGGSLFIGGGRLTDATGSGGGVVKIGTGTLALSGTASSYDTAPAVLGGLMYSDPGVQPVPVDGDIIVIDGSFDISAMPATAGNLMLANGTIITTTEIRVHGNVVASSGACTIGPNGGGVGTLSIDGTSAQGRFDILDGTMDLQSAFSDIGDGENLVKSGSGTLILSQPAIFTGAAAYVQEGILKLGVSGALPATANLTVGASGMATFDLGGYDQTLDRIYDANNSLVTGPGTLTINPSIDQLSGMNCVFSGCTIIKQGPYFVNFSNQGCGGLSGLKIENGQFSPVIASDGMTAALTVASGGTFDVGVGNSSFDFGPDGQVEYGGMLHFGGYPIAVFNAKLNGLDAVLMDGGGVCSITASLESDSVITVASGSTLDGSVNRTKGTTTYTLAQDGTGTHAYTVTPP